MDDQPPDIPDWKCRICGHPMRVRHYNILGRWLHPTVHDRCSDQWSRDKAALDRGGTSHEIPERFARFDGTRADAEATRLCGAFSPQSKVKTLAIIGTPHRGKSRLLWATVQSFFDELGHGWPEAFVFETLMAEFDKPILQRIATARYVLIDDVGSCESYGRERAALQAALRSRIKASKWTFLTIDSMSFDPDLEHVFEDRALVVPV